MNNRNGRWMAGASLFALVNATGAGYAVAMGESLHAATHGALMVVGVAVAWVLMLRVARREVPALPQVDDRLERLQQSMDAIALEVERIGEAARFSAKIESERIEPRR